MSNPCDDPLAAPRSPDPVVSRLAHDLNNLLGAMVAFGTLARMQVAESSSTRNYLDQILEACRQAAVLVRQLSAHNRGVNEGFPLHPSPGTTTQLSIGAAGEMPSEPAPGPVGPSRSTLVRILCVDDEPSLARVYRQALKRLGYEVVLAGSGTEALDLFTAEPDRFDAVITDWGLPGMDGRSLSEALHHLRPQLPILLVTGDLGSHAASHALPKRWRGVLAKPFTISELQSAVAAIIGRGNENV